MNKSEIISSCALAISISSFFVSLYVAFRDRARLRIKCRFFKASEYGSARIQVSIVNIGRRPAILRSIGGTDKDGRFAAQFLEYDKGGIRLNEHERFERLFEKDDTICFLPDEDICYEELWVEDSLGYRHKIPNSKKYIRQLWK